MEIILDNMNVNYTLDAVGGNIFHVRCETKKDLAFLFLRAQEFYESDNPSFYRKNFKIEDFKDWYCKCFTGQRLFTYPYDWCGFNVPGEQAIAATEGALQIGDNNSFDDAMREIILRCQQKNEKFYLIGTRDSATELHDMNSTFIHEIAHAFYYLEADYRKYTNEIIQPILNHFKTKLFARGYNVSVVSDETQAYLVSGAEALGITFDYSKYRREVRSVFEEQFLRTIK